MICPRCNKEMTYIGNADNVILLSHPPQIRVVYICKDCKIKSTGTIFISQVHFPKPDLNQYEEVKE